MAKSKLDISALEDDFNTVATDRRKKMNRIKRDISRLEKDFPFLVDGEPLEDDASEEDHAAQALYLDKLEALAGAQLDIQGQLVNAVTARQRSVETDIKEGGLIPAASITGYFAELARRAMRYIPAADRYLFQGDYRELQHKILLDHEGVAKSLAEHQTNKQLEPVGAIEIIKPK